MIIVRPEHDWFHLVDLAAKPIHPEHVALKRTKIVATIGPASEKLPTLRQLIRNGMDVARLNFSHGDHRDHKRRIATLRLAAQKEKKYLGLLQDIQGPKIRVGRFEESKILLKKGQTFVVTTSDILGDEKRVSCTYKRLHEDIKPGHRILLDDGLIFLIVERVRGRDIITRVVFGGVLKDSKGMNLPDTHVRVSCLTPKDRKDIEFGLENHVDFIALSFVQKASDVRMVRKIIERVPHPPLLIAKIESALAVQDLAEIIKVSDGLMVARGDLGVECPMEQVPALQKQIIRAANEAGRFVITATQMLESMTSKPRPTRAEASDVANAVMDGTDAVMLSAETASGDFPVESLKTMTRIILRTEEYQVQFPTESQVDRYRHLAETSTTAVTAAAVQATKSLDCSGIVAFTHSGTTAFGVSRLRPHVPIFGLSPFDRILRKLSIVWGVIPYVTSMMKHTDDMPRLARPALQAYGLWKMDSHIVILSGTPVARPGTTNLLKVHQIK